MVNMLHSVIVFVTVYLVCICCARLPAPSALHRADNVPQGTMDPLNVSIISWNMAEKAPNEADCAFLKDYRNRDIVVFGIQECEDIRPRRREGHRTRKWRYLQRKLLGRQFQCLASHKMGGLFISVYAKNHARKEVQGMQLVDVACGVGNVLTNKGAVGVVMRIRNKTVALVNSHLAAHQKYTKQRNLDFHRVLDATVEAAQPMLRMFQAPYSVNKAQITPAAAASTTPGGKTSKYARATKATRTTRPGSKPASSSAQAWESTLRSVTSFARTSTSKNRPSRRPLRSRPQRLPSVTIKPTERIPEVEQIPFDALVFFGDLNYRIDLPRSDIEQMHNQLVKKVDTTTADVVAASLSDDGDMKVGEEKASPAPKKWDNRYLGFHGDATLRTPRSKLLARVLRHDQLNRQRKLGRAFVGFEEGEICFPPTYKYDKNARSFDTSSKRRCPAWTDRILYYTRKENKVTNGAMESQKASQETAAEARPAGPAVVSEVVCVVPQKIQGGEDSQATGGVKGVQNAPVLRLRDYYSVDARTSDHRPVCADFELHL